MLGSVEPKFWRSFCDAAGRGDWTDRQSEAMPQTALIADVAAWFARLTLDQALARFDGIDCCLSPVLDLGEALTSEQVTERGLVQGAQALFPAKFDGETTGLRAPLFEMDSR